MSQRSAIVITASNRASQGIYSDLSGQSLKEGLVALGFNTSNPIIVADDIDAISQEIKALANKIRLIVTTGGTGFHQLMSPRSDSTIY